MPALAYILCERRSLPAPDARGDWETEARFLLPTPDAFMDVLARGGVAGRGHPSDLSIQVSTDILFEDGDIIGQTVVHPGDLPGLLPHADAVTAARLRAWLAFCRSFEEQGMEARLIVWFIR